MKMWTKASLRALGACLGETIPAGAWRTWDGQTGQEDASDRDEQIDPESTVSWEKTSREEAVREYFSRDRFLVRQSQSTEGILFCRVGAGERMMRRIGQRKRRSKASEKYNAIMKDWKSIA
jgi:hypothetical protein